MIEYLRENIWDMLTALGTTGAVIFSLFTVLKKPKPKLDLRHTKFEKSSSNNMGIIPEKLILNIIPRNFHLNELLFVGISQGNVNDISSCDIVKLLRSTKTELYPYTPEGESREIIAYVFALGNNPLAVTPLFIFKDEHNRSWLYFKGVFKKIDNKTHQKYIDIHYYYLNTFGY